MPVPRFIRGSGSSANESRSGVAGGGQEEPAEVVDLDGVLDGPRPLRQWVVELGQLGVDRHELGGPGVTVGIGDRPDHTVVVGEHGHRPPVDLGRRPRP